MVDGGKSGKRWKVTGLQYHVMDMILTEMTLHVDKYSGMIEIEVLTSSINDDEVIHPPLMV